MAAYVDDMRARVGLLVMCHMIADSSTELHAMADRIGVARRWVQKAGTAEEHYDICLTKRRSAVYHGAIELTKRELLAKVIARRPPLGPLPIPITRPRVRTVVPVAMKTVEN